LAAFSKSPSAVASTVIDSFAHFLNFPCFHRHTRRSDRVFSTTRRNRSLAFPCGDFEPQDPSTKNGFNVIVGCDEGVLGGSKGEDPSTPHRFSFSDNLSSWLKRLSRVAEFDKV
jgi:hypothetical protein